MWIFKKLEKGFPERDPHEAEFFRLRHVSDSLIRETIQNSLDAKRDDEQKIKICFTFGSVLLSEINYYMENLEPHLEASGLPSLDGNSLSFLTIEDYGTTGLDGTTWESGTKPGRGESDFYDFWWSEGISGKKNTRAGRWGLGKTTFHIVSKFRTFWGYTVRFSDSKRLLMGKALLKTHILQNDSYHYFGYFTDDGTYNPIDEINVLDDFKRKFAIARKNNEAGLSLVIPNPDEDLSLDTILRSTIIHYFYPMASSKMEIEIKNNSHNILIDKENLLEIASLQNWTDTFFEAVDIKELFKFIYDTISIQRYQMINFVNPEKPELTKESFSDFDSLKNQFNSEEIVAFKVQVSIRKSKEEVSYPTYFKVYFKKYPQLNNSEEYWIRSGNRIIDINTLGGHAVRCLIVADDPAISSFLGDAETPAHTEWKENTEGFKDKYKNAVNMLRFVKQSASKIVLLLDEIPKEIQKDFLKNIFYIRTPQKENENDDNNDKTKSPKKIPKGYQSKFIIRKINKGFNVCLDLSNNKFSLPLRANVRVAYDVRNGNPFNQYEMNDFDFRNLKIDIKGGKIRSKKYNKIVMTVISKNFSLQVTGFDINRDLVVIIEESKNETPN